MTIAQDYSEAIFHVSITIVHNGESCAIRHIPVGSDVRTCLRQPSVRLAILYDIGASYDEIA